MDYTQLDNLLAGSFIYQEAAAKAETVSAVPVEVLRRDLFDQCYWLWIELPIGGKFDDLIKECFARYVTKRAKECESGYVDSDWSGYEQSLTVLYSTHAFTERERFFIEDKHQPLFAKYMMQKELLSLGWFYYEGLRLTPEPFAKIFITYFEDNTHLWRRF